MCWAISSIYSYYSSIQETWRGHSNSSEIWIGNEIKWNQRWSFWYYSHHISYPSNPVRWLNFYAAELYQQIFLFNRQSWLFPFIENFLEKEIKVTFRFSFFSIEINCDSELKRILESNEEGGAGGERQFSNLRLQSSEDFQHQFKPNFITM